MRVESSQAEIGLYTWGKKVSKTTVPLASYVIDVSGFRDPMSNRGFRKLYPDGRCGEVQKYVKEDPRYPAISDSVRMIAEMHLRGEGSDSKWVSIGIMDYHGLWIAPPIGELLADELDRAGFRVSLYHYDVLTNGLSKGVTM